MMNNRVIERILDFAIRKRAPVGYEDPRECIGFNVCLDCYTRIECKLDVLKDISKWRRMRKEGEEQ